GVTSCKLCSNVFSILNKLVRSMWESERDRLASSAPRQDPISIRLNFTCRIRSAHNNLSVSNSADIVLCNAHMVEGAEHDIEVDWLPFKDMFPLRVRETSGR